MKVYDELLSDVLVTVVLCMTHFYVYVGNKAKDV